MTTRDVEGLSLQISQSKQNSEYYISHAWLTDIENGRFTPSIYKLYSLSAIYGSPFAEMLGHFGLDLDGTGTEPLGTRSPGTHLLSGRISEIHEEIHLPVQLSEGPYMAQTKVFSPTSEASQHLPLSMLQYLNSKDRLLGFVGLQDFTLYPILRPGSFVEINPRQNKVRTVPWKNEHDRPIYFVDCRDRYVCSWCQIDDRQLSIVPHPISRQQIQRFKYPDEAEIVGRVTAVAMRFTNFDNSKPSEQPKMKMP